MKMKMRMTAEPSRCSVSSCSCVCFRPGRLQIRSCDRCGHGWVAHASQKLQAHPPSSAGPVEVALPGLVLDLSSLVLYGAQAIPVRLKILLDRLYSVLTPEQVGHILRTLGWSLGDYVRGYMLQPAGLQLAGGEEMVPERPFRDLTGTVLTRGVQLQSSTILQHPSGTVLDRWFMVTPEEEQFILKQFLRFGETRPIVELMTLQFLDTSEPELKCVPKRQSMSLLLPFDFPASAFLHQTPPGGELVASSKLTQILHQAGGKRIAEDGDAVAHRPSVKNDPDEGNSPRSEWHQPSSWGLTQQDMSTSMSPSLNSSSITSFPSSSFPAVSNSSTSPLDIGSSSLHPLPSFSSSFLCPFRSSFSPLPSSLCSLSSSRGGRKGRVCCGVCGKSFYDKGTLKIHYNAVHLKIKHRCTVAGCTMVFSSLRSRNRHSANPNPRLHTGSSRDARPHGNTRYVHSDAQEVKQAYELTRMCRERETSNTLWPQDDDDDDDDDAHAIRNKDHTNHHGCQHNTPLQVDPSPPFHPAPSQDTNQIIPFKSQQAPPPPRHLHPTQSTSSSPACSSLVTPQEDPLTSNTPPTSPLSSHTPICTVSYGNRSVPFNSDVAEGNTCTSLPTRQQWPFQSADAIPKKKPRKSRMPVKIEQWRTYSRRHNNEEEEEC